MGRIALLGPNGQERTSVYFGTDMAGGATGPEFANDGVITPLEISDGRTRLEEEINQQICGYGGPLGLGGWGGINEVCVQPWNMGGPARENTPDGYSTEVTVRLQEDYREPAFLFLHNVRTTDPVDIHMTMRWENGRVRLYQCTPPLYAPPPPPPPEPDIGAELKAVASSVGDGIRGMFSGAQSVASSALQSISKFFA